MAPRWRSSLEKARRNPSALAINPHGHADIVAARVRRRSAPLTLADELRGLLAVQGEEELAFAGLVGRPYDPHHLHLRVLKPACAEAGVEWAGFHTFRHTVASRMFDAGRNAAQIQHWLGHHSAAFTLKTYVHLLDPSDLGGPVEARGANKVQTGPTPSGDIRDLAGTAEMSV